MNLYWKDITSPPKPMNQNVLGEIFVASYTAVQPSCLRQWGPAYNLPYEFPKKQKEAKKTSADQKPCPH